MQQFEVTRNSDADFQLRVRNINGTPFNLTGIPVSAITDSPELSGRINVAIEDAAQGLISGQINWHPDFLLGRKMSFQVGLMIQGRMKASPVIYMVVL